MPVEPAMATSGSPSGALARASSTSKIRSTAEVILKIPERYSGFMHSAVAIVNRKHAELRRGLVSGAKFDWCGFDERQIDGCDFVGSAATRRHCLILSKNR